MLRDKELEADQERANAEAEAKKAREEEARLAKEKELAEQRKKDAEELAKAKEKALQNEKQWQDKLLSQQISILEKEKESAVEGAEERGEATYEIERYYNERLLTLKLEQVEKERKEALNAENVTADAKIAINEYYDNEVKKVYDDLGKYKKAKKKEEVKEEKKSFDQMLEIAKQYAEKLAGVFSKISGIAKTVFSKIVSLSKSIFSFNVDDALTNLLKFEDSVLTFFVETLPKLPDFFASAMQSIFVLLNNVSNIILNNSDAIINNLTVLVKNIINGIANWVTSGGWQDILNALLVIQTAIENAIADNMEEIANTIREMLPALIDFLVKSISSASKTLGKIAKSLLPLIADLINAIIDVITSDEVVEASIDAIAGLIEGLIPAVVKLITKAIPKLITFSLIKLPSYTPRIIRGVIDGLIKGSKNINWADTALEMFRGFFEALTDIFQHGFADAVKDGIQEMLSGFKKLLKKIREVIDAYNEVTEDNPALRVGLAIATGGLSEIPHWFAKGTNNAPAGLSVVGEAGPELVKFRGGEQVLNSHNTEKALANMGGNTNNFNVTFNNLQDTTAFRMMQQLKAYNRQMAINGVI